MAKKSRKALTRLADVLEYCRHDEAPITLLGATPFGCLGLGGWAPGLQHVSALDCIAGLHRGTFSPETDKLAVFHTAAETCNELLRHSEVRMHLNSRGPGHLWPTDADEETHFLAKELGQDILLAKPDIRRKLSDPVELRSLLEKSGVAFVPQTTGVATSHEELMVLARKAKFDGAVVVQTTDENGEKNTSFISRAKDWDNNKDALAGKPLTISRYILHTSHLVEAVAMVGGHVSGPVFQLLNAPGIAGIVADASVAEGVRSAVVTAVKKIASAIVELGFVGTFTCTFYVETGTGKVFLRHLLPSLTVYSQLTHFLTSLHGGVPLHLFHLLSHADVDVDLDFNAIQKRWSEHPRWTQLVLRHDIAGTDFITKSPASSIYALDQNEQPELVADSVRLQDLRSQKECLFLRTLGTGTYRSKGLECGLLFASGNMFDNESAGRWASAMESMFNAVQMSGTSLPTPGDAGARISLF